MPWWFILRSLEYFGIHRGGPTEVLSRHLSAGGTEYSHLALSGDAMFRQRLEPSTSKIRVLSTQLTQNTQSISVRCLESYLDDFLKSLSFHHSAPAPAFPTPCERFKLR